MKTTISTERKFFLPLRPSDIALWFLAALHLLLTASFFLVLMSLSPARATEEISCGGKNLLTELQTTDPQRYADVLSKGKNMPNGKGSFWKIEKAGTEPSYLLGTMHVTDPRVLTMPPTAAEAHAQAATIIIESDEILDERKAAAALLTKPELTMFLDGRTITDLLSPEDARKLEAGLKEKGIPLAAVARMQPWMLSSFVVLPACEFARKAKGVAFLDKKIAQDALDARKHVTGLETLTEQLEAMAGLPVEFHLQALIETLELGDRMNDIMETMTQLYLSGDIGMTMPMLEAVTPDHSGEGEQGYAAFEKRVIVDRNRTMAERAAPFLKEGSVFMAVGALHLPGEEGLVELLRQQGYTLTALN